ncbi:Utp14-domain-containing protein [Dentipellis sp. KUC8613]|nr:Utp14-domain-containing protein [Dentipellis sp. KUC8613]
MAKTPRAGRPAGKPISSARKPNSNAAGYQKRLARKGKSQGAPSDVYEFQSKKVRRENVQQTLDRDEEDQHGSSDDDIDRQALRARLIGETVDNEQIDPEDDEELDSDAAFEESDEEQFAGFTFRSKGKAKARPKKQSKTHGVRFAEVDLNEDDSDMNEEIEEENAEGSEEEEEEEEGDPDDFIDVLDVLDGRAAPYLGSDDDEDRPARNEDAKGGRSDEDEDEGEESGAEAPNDDISMSGDEQEADPDALEGLGNFISSLETGKKRKADDTAGADDAGRRKRRIIAERTEAGQEHEFAAQASGADRLDLDDLLDPLTSQSSNMLSLKKSAKALKSSKMGTTLSAPLPLRTQDRLDREAAYEQTKQEAEHLSFPLQAQPAGKTSNLELAAKFKPTTELESAVDRLLKQAQMREQDLAKTEDLKMNHLSVEEVAARRAEVRKIRELMFRAEMKAKRVSKIKSKAYRRIKKKEKERLAAKLDGEVDEDDEETRMKREQERALERATLRHKNTGKWAKAMKGRGELDVDQRAEITEMLERGERLRRKIRGDKDSDNDEDDSEEDEDMDVEGLRARAFDEMAQLKDHPTADGEGSGKSKSVFDMKFMRDAEAREQHVVDREADDFMKEMQGLEDAVVEAPDAGNAIVERVGGRVSFRPGNQPELATAPPPLAPVSDTSSVTLRSTDLPPLSATWTAQTASLASTSPVETSNPWLARAGPSGSGLKKSEVIVAKESKAAEKSKNKLKKRQEEGQEQRDKAREDAELEISLDNVLTVNDAASSSSPAGPSTKHSANGDDGDDSDANSEVEHQEKLVAAKGKGKQNGKANAVQAFQQRDLIAAAFAGDNVTQDFQSAKRREIESDAPKEVDTTLPGWGAWGGTGTRKQKSKPHLIKKIAGIDPKSRADYGKAHVIISEKRDKKAAKYMVKDLPYPYTSQAQFERRLDTPIGTEWSTRVAFQRATLPKVTKKMGTVINPLEKLF